MTFIVWSFLLFRSFLTIWPLLFQSMTEPENADDEEIQAEGEYDSDTDNDDLKTYLKEHSLSFARQVHIFIISFAFD